MEKAKTLKSIRSFFESWGLDTSALTDEELEISIHEASKSAASFGMTMDEAAGAIASTLGRQ